MQYEQDLIAFVREHREALAFLLRMQEPLSDYDLGIFCGYLAHAASEDGHRKLGRIDSGLALSEIRSLPFARRSQETLIKALSWWERGQVAHRPLPQALATLPQFSPHVQDKLLRGRRVRQYRKDFGALASSVTRLGQRINELAGTLLANINNLDDPRTQKALRQQITRIHHTLQSCDYRARSGVIWATKVGVPLDKAVMAVNRVYLKRLKRIEKAFTALDALTAEIGMPTNMSQVARTHYGRWRDEFGQAFDEHARGNDLDAAAMSM